MGSVHVWIIDQPFPADGGAWFFEVDPHNQHELIVNTSGECCQSPCIVNCSISVMDGTGTDDNHQASVIPLKDFFQALAALVDKLGVSSRKRKDLAQVGRCNDGGDGGDFEVVGLDHLRYSPRMVNELL